MKTLIKHLARHRRVTQRNGQMYWRIREVSKSNHLIEDKKPFSSFLEAPLLEEEEIDEKKYSSTNFKLFAENWGVPLRTRDHWDVAKQLYEDVKFIRESMDDLWAVLGAYSNRSEVSKISEALEYDLKLMRMSWGMCTFKDSSAYDRICKMACDALAAADTRFKLSFQKKGKQWRTGLLILER